MTAWEKTEARPTCWGPGTEASRAPESNSVRWGGKERTEMGCL